MTMAQDIYYKQVTIETKNDLLGWFDKSTVYPYLEYSKGTNLVKNFGQDYYTQ